MIVHRASIGLFLAATLLASGGQARKKEDERLAELEESHRRWLESVELLFEEGERDAFLRLETDGARDTFIESFWRRRDPHPETARNELREEWMYLATMARQEFGDDLSDERARFVFENGWPDERWKIRCRGVKAHEIWLYRASAAIREDVPLIFYPMGWEQRIWDPWDTEVMFYRDHRRPAEPPRGCDFEIFLGTVDRIRELNRPRGAYAELLARFGTTSLRRFLEQPHMVDPTAMPEGSETFDARIDYSFPGRRQSRTVVHGLVAVPVAEVEPIDLRGVRSYNFDLFGKVLRYTDEFETFRYRFDLPVRQVAGDTLPLVFDRLLRPGDYEIVLRVEDLRSGRSFYARREISVPSIEIGETAAEPAGAQEGPARARLEILDEPAETRTDMVRVRFRPRRPDVDRVDFSVDGKKIFSRRRPPYGVELDLGDLPATRTLRATAFDAGGRAVASDVLLVNPNPHKLVVRLVEPVLGQSYSGGLTARAEVSVPDGRRLEWLELYRDDQRVARFDRGPFRQWVDLAELSKTTLVRAVARLDDGTAAEDVVIVNSPDPGDEVTVDLVELFVTVVGPDRRPVEGLGASDFSVFEDGRRQGVRGFELARDLPLNATLMIDLSASMAPRLETAREAALDFFEQTIGERDSLALVTFNHHPAVAVAPTHDFERFAEGLAGLRAEGGTALYDSLVFALFYGEALKGHRAVLLLSDGLDEDSRYGVDEALRAVRRAGVAIYSIGLDLGGRGRARRTLRKLSQDSGGRAFFVDSAAELGGVYATIRSELATKYLLTYQSDAPDPTGSEEVLRRVEVEMRGGLEALTIRGYIP